MRNDYRFCSDDSCFGCSSTELQKVLCFNFPSVLFFSFPFTYVLQCISSLLNVHFMYFSYLIFSEWGASLLVSICDTRLSCDDMLASITGSCSHTCSVCVIWFIWLLRMLLSSLIWRTPICCICHSAKLFNPNILLHVTEFSVASLCGGLSDSGFICLFSVGSTVVSLSTYLFLRLRHLVSLVDNLI